MTKKRILIFDDDTQRAKGWSDSIRESTSVRREFATPEIIKPPEFQAAIRILNERRKSARKTDDEESIAPIEFDSADIFLIDFDLFELNEITYITGEEVAYLARCYSRCGIIVGVNQFRKYGDKLFDLTLKGRPESFADINLNTAHLSTPGLWKEPWKGFRPWYWPLLPLEVEANEERVRNVLENLDVSILDFLGLASFRSVLSRAALEFLETSGHPPQSVTFREFVLNSANAMRRHDRPIDLEQIARIAAARIHKWLERLVLPGQDVLVDTPHLVSRFPSLFKGARMSGAAWDKTAMIREVDPKVIDTKILAQFAFPRPYWVSRPCWFWNPISRCDDILEVRNPWQVVQRGDLVFCEDLSAFRKRKDSKEFLADVDSAYARRFVAGLKDVAYEPQVRLAM